MTNKKLDIFDVLSNLNDKNYNFYDELEDEQTKQFAPLVVNRWMTGCGDSLQVYLDNEIVNPYIFSLQHHKSLLWKLMCISNSGKKQRYNWIKPPSVNKTSSLAIDAICQYYKYNVRQATQAFAILNKEEVIKIASELGWQPDMISALQKQLKPT